jgi:uncharacterized membrane protein YvlD (DUF360 family)
MLLELLFGIVNHSIRLVLKINDLSSLLIVGLGCFSLLDHSVYILVRQTTAGSDCHV